MKITIKKNATLGFDVELPIGRVKWARTHTEAYQIALAAKGKYPSARIEDLAI